jgi:hypothetical protein
MIAEPSRGSSTSSSNSACVPIREHRIARRERRARLVPRLRGQTAGQPGDLDRQPVEPLGELAVVLLGKDFGRRHERDLPSRFDRLQRGSAATIVLPLPTSPCSSRCIGIVRFKSWLISAPDTLLRAGEREGNPRSEARRSARPVPVRTGARRAARALRCAFNDSCCATISSNLMRVHAGCVRSSRLRCTGIGRRGAGACRNCTASGNFHRRSRAMSEPGSNSAVSCGSAASARTISFRSVSWPSPRRRRIDGRETIGQRRPRLDHLELRMHDLAAEVAVAHIAEHADTTPRRERLLLTRIEVEEAQNELRARAPSPSSSRHTSCRRGRYWISVLTTVPSACCDTPLASAASGTIRV